MALKLYLKIQSEWCESEYVKVGCAYVSGVNYGV